MQDFILFSVKVFDKLVNHICPGPKQFSSLLGIFSFVIDSPLSHFTKLKKQFGFLYLV